MIADNLIKNLKRNEELIIILGVSLCWHYLWLELTLLQEQSAKWSLKLLLMRVHRDIGMILKTRSALISNATILVSLLLIYKEKQNLNVYSVKYRKSSFSSLDPWHWWKILIPRNPTPRKPPSIRFSSCLHCVFFGFHLTISIENIFFLNAENCTLNLLLFKISSREADSLFDLTKQ